MSDADALAGLVDANNATEQSYLTSARAAISRGAPVGDVADRLGLLVHQYRATLGQKTDQPDYSGAGGTAAGAIAAGYQGLTLGAGNKITSGLQAAGDAVTGNGFDYGNRLKQNTDILDQFRSRHPVASTALQIAGSVPTAMVGAPAATLGKLALQGAGYGGASGAMEAIRPGATAGHIAQSGVGGALLGSIAAPLVGGAMKVPGMIAGRDAGSQADEMLQAALARAKQSRSGIFANVQPSDAELSSSVPFTRPAPSTVMDQGPAVQKLVRAARNVPTSTAEQQTTDFLQQRAADTADRLHAALTTGTGHAPEEAWMTDAQLQAAKEQAASPAYEQAFASAPIPLSASAGEGQPTLQELLQRPSAQSAMNYADKLNAEQGIAPLTDRILGTPSGIPPERFAELKAQGLDKFLPTSSLVGTPAPDVIPVQDLHNLKLRLDDMIGYAKSRGTTLDGSAATRAYLGAVEDTKNQLLDIMDTHAPPYKTARNAYAGASDIQDALQQGQDDFAANVRPSQAAANRTDLSTDSERTFYDRGMLSAARDVISTNAANPDLPQASRQVNIVQRLLGNPQQAEKIKGLFPSDQSYQTFLSQMGQEAQYPQTAKALLNQSTTASQQAERSLTPSAWTARDAVMTAMGSPMAAVRLGAKGISALANRAQGMNAPVADAIGQRATLTGQPLTDMLQRLQTTPSPSPTPGIAGRTAASLAGSASAQPSAPSTPQTSTPTASAQLQQEAQQAKATIQTLPISPQEKQARMAEVDKRLKAAISP